MISDPLTETGKRDAPAIISQVDLEELACHLIKLHEGKPDFLIGILEHAEEDLMPSASKTGHLNRLEQYGYSFAYRRILEQLSKAKQYRDEKNLRGCRSAVLVGLDWVSFLRKEADA